MTKTERDARRYHFLRGAVDSILQGHDGEESKGDVLKLLKFATNVADTLGATNEEIAGEIPAPNQ